MLLYGPDAGLVAERAAALAQIFVNRGKDQTEIVRLDDRDLAEDPARLEVELKTAPMFASQSVIRVAAGARLDVPSLKALVATPLGQCPDRRGWQSQAQLGSAQNVRDA